jgi:hypothetical protein
MRTELIKIIYLLIALLFIRASCATKALNCANTKYSFELPIKAYPGKEKMHVGDTLWFEITSPTTLKDQLSSKEIDYSNAANLGSSVAFSTLSSEGEFTINCVSRFDYLLKSGIELSRGYANGLINEYGFTETSNEYRFLLAIIPKDTGTYRIGFSNAANVSRQNDKCTKAEFALNFRNTDQHYYLAPGYNPNGPTLVGGDYYFKVN